jgi:hypothetical protein
VGPACRRREGSGIKSSKEKTAGWAAGRK